MERKRREREKEEREIDIKKVYESVCIYKWKRVYTNMHTNLYMHEHVYQCTLYKCTNACMYTCMCSSICEQVLVFVCINASACVCVCVQVHVRVQICACGYVIASILLEKGLGQSFCLRTTWPHKVESAIDHPFKTHRQSAAMYRIVSAEYQSKCVCVRESVWVCCWEGVWVMLCLLISAADSF